MCVEMSVIEIGPVRILRDLTGERKKHSQKYSTTDFIKNKVSKKSTRDRDSFRYVVIYLCVCMCVIIVYLYMTQRAKDSVLKCSLTF